jgi:muramidase (phage lysozyme)
MTTVFKDVLASGCLVVLATSALSGCGSGQMKSSSDTTSVAAGISRPSSAVLAVIAHAEGTGDRYDYIFSYKTFSSFHDHPRRVVCSGGYCSDAAGRYQFLSTSWDETRRGAGVSNFEPASQDLGALYRMESFRGAREHKQQLSRAEFERLMYKINREWASLPGSPYGQPTKSMGSLWAVYEKSL